MGKKIYAGVNGIARNIIRQYVNVGSNFPKINLPEGYIQLEYIQTGTNQFIKSGVIASTKIRVTMDAQIIGDETGYYFGCTGDREFAFAWEGLWSDDEYGYAALYYKGYYPIKDAVATPSYRHLVELGPTYVKIDNIEYASWNLTEEFENESENEIWLFGSNSYGGNSASGALPLKCYGCKIYEENVLIRNFIPCQNSSGQAGLFDIVNNVFYKDHNNKDFIKGSTYQENMVKPVIKAYVGINGIARQFWYIGNKSISYFGKAPDLSYARGQVTALSIDKYAIFTGRSSYLYPFIDAYDPALIKTMVYYSPDTESGKGMMGAATIGKYGLLAGGYDYTKKAYSNVVEIIDNNLIRQTPRYLNSAKQKIAAATIGNYAIFAGGHGSNQATNETEAFNSSLTKNTSIQPLTTASYCCAGTSVGNYAIFAGDLELVEIYDKSLTKHISSITLSRTRNEPSAVTFGNNAIFAGGYTYVNQPALNIVDAYNSSLTHTVLQPLNEGKFRMASGVIGNYALFGGGDMCDYDDTDDDYGDMSQQVEAYNSSLVKISIDGNLLPDERYGMAAAVTGSYLLMGGGYKHSNSQKTVYAYTI